MALDEAQKAYLQKIMGDTKAARERLKEYKDEAADKVDAAGVSINGPSKAFGGQVVDPVDAIGEYRKADNAINALTKLERNREPTEEETQALSAIVLKEGRPSLLIQNSSFVVPKTGEFADSLREHKKDLEAIFGSVGRIEATSESPISYFGTGFLIAPDVLLTNRHVAQFFIKGSGDLSLRDDILPRIDFVQEHQVERSLTANIKQALLIHDFWDAAVLQVDWAGQPPSGTPLPLAGATPRDVKEILVAAIGYPAMDRRKPESIPVQQQIFDNIFEKKRMAPGYTTGRDQFLSFSNKVNALMHDCSTLGGNSGSCIYDLDSKRVIGLHFAGVYLKANYSVPTWELADNAVLKSVGVNFV